MILYWYVLIDGLKRLKYRNRRWRSKYRFNMKNNNLIRFVQSLVLLPVMTMSLTVPGISGMGTSNVLVQKVNIEASGVIAANQAIVPKVDQVVNPKVDAKAQILKAEAEAIDAYFDSHDMPLKGTGMKMATMADQNGLDWRLLPAIAVRESTGGKNDCSKVDNNPFGWASCKVGFKTIDESIATVAVNLGGNNPKTAHHYDNQTVKGILHAYNPPSIVPRYAEQVMSIMNTIGSEDISSSLASANT